MTVCSTAASRLSRLVTFVTLLAVATLGGRSPASAAPAAASPTREVVIRTLPPLGGVRLAVGSQTLVTGADGSVPATVSKDLNIETGVVAVDGEIPVAENVRARPDRVYAERDNVTVGFSFDYLTTFSFKHGDEIVPPSAVGALVLKSSVGAVAELQPGEAAWLQGSRVVRDTTGLSSKDIYYTVERVEVGGLNVVNANQQRIVPRLAQHLDVELLFFSIAIKARDAFFGFPVGRSVRIEYPSGRREERALSGSGIVTLDKLPRGDYQVLVRGGGLKVSHPIAVSRDQPVDLKVFSFFDIGLVGFVAFLVILLLLWFSFQRRLRLRRERGAAFNQADDVPLGEPLPVADTAEVLPPDVVVPAGART